VAQTIKCFEQLTTVKNHPISDGQHQRLTRKNN